MSLLPYNIGLKINPASSIENRVASSQWRKPSIKIYNILRYILYISQILST